MRFGLRSVMASLLLLLLWTASLVATPVAAGLPPPDPIRPAGSPGSWYSGGTPPDLDPSTPVLVFVHGKGGSGAAWWTETAYHGINDMYATAYANGFRTAFVNLEPEGDMWVNGRLLSQQLAEIADHFGVEQVVVVAHSKGGVDVNAAAAFYGAGPLISKVIALGSPHWGTPIADLAYSTWTWWLSALLGLQTDAAYVMQTGYMAWFRSLADNAGDTVPYYTLSGRKCGPFLTALWWGCVYLAGEDDGVVPLGYGHKPGGIVVLDGRWDHDEIRMGSRAWASLEGVLGPSSEGSSLPPSAASGALTNMVARGGQVLGEAAGQPFPLESGVRKATLVFYASSPDFTATLTGPDSSVHTVTMQGKVPSGEVFAGAWIGSLELEKPAAGTWKFETAAPQRAGYLIVAALDSDLSAWLDVGGGPSVPGGQRTLTVAFDHAVRSATVTGALTVAGARPYAQPSFGSATGGDYRVTVTLPQQQGVHNLTVTATGTLADGSRFERTLVSGFAVVVKGTKGSWTGR